MRLILRLINRFNDKLIEIIEKLKELIFRIPLIKKGINYLQDKLIHLKQVQKKNTQQGKTPKEVIQENIVILKGLVSKAFAHFKSLLPYLIPKKDNFIIYIGLLKALWEKIKFYLKILANKINAKKEIIKKVSLFLLISFIPLYLIISNAINVFYVLFPPQDPPDKIFTYTRPKYYKKEKRLINIGQVYLPLVLNNKEAYKSLILNLIVLGSNRYIKHYFTTYNHEVSDFITNNLESIDPKFLLTDEGKNVMKKKIQLVLNEFLKIRKISGNIEDVFIENVFVD